MSTIRILALFIRLFSGWGLGRDDFCLGGEYGLRLNGYRLRPRRRHFDFFVVAKKLPWPTTNGAESTVPPSNSRAFEAFRQFLLATRCDPHLVPVPQIDITPANLIRHSRFHRLAGGQRIRIITPLAQLKNYYTVLIRCNIKRRWAEEKMIRWYRQFSRFRREAQRLGHRDIVRWCKKCTAVMTRLELDRQNSPVAFKGKLRGIPVEPGRVRGRARLISADEDLNKVRPGDVVIMPFARTEIIRVIHRISGLVTDQGGISAHASVISREYHVPCVIATRIATQMFKDGDRIEVDATRGVVKKT